MKLIAVAAALIGILPAIALPGGTQLETDGSQQALGHQDTPVGELALSQLIDQLPDVGLGRLPVGDGWVDRPGVAELRLWLRSRKGMPGELWKRALLETGALRYRKRWPANIPIAISMRPPSWIGVASIRMTSITPGIDHARGSRLPGGLCGTCTSWSRRRALYQELGTLPIGSHILAFQVEVERFHPGPWPTRPGAGSSLTWRQMRAALDPANWMLGQFRLELPIEIVPTLDDAIPPISDEATDEAVRDCISLAFANWRVEGGVGLTTILVIDPSVERYPLLASLGLSLSVEVLKGSEVIQEKHLVVNSYDSLALSNSVSGAKQIAFSAFREVPAALNTNRFDRSDWSIRVTGTSKDVHPLWEAERYWSGTIEFPVDEAIERERERAPNGREPWIWSPTNR